MYKNSKIGKFKQCGGDVKNVTIIDFECTITQFDTYDFSFGNDRNKFYKTIALETEKKNKLMEYEKTRGNIYGLIEHNEFISLVFGSNERTEFIKKIFNDIKSKGEFLILVCSDNVYTDILLSAIGIYMYNFFDVIYDNFLIIINKKNDDSQKLKTLLQENAKLTPYPKNVAQIIQLLFTTEVIKIVLFDDNSERTFSAFGENFTCIKKEKFSKCTIDNKTCIIFTAIPQNGTGLQPDMLDETTLNEIYETEKEKKDVMPNVGQIKTLWYVETDEQTGNIYENQPSTANFRKCNKGKKTEELNYKYLTGEINNIVKHVKPEEETKLIKTPKDIYYCENKVETPIRQEIKTQGGNINTYGNYKTNKHAYSFLKQNT